MLLSIFYISLHRGVCLSHFVGSHSIKERTMEGLLSTSRAIDDMHAAVRSYTVPTFRVSTMTWSAKFAGFGDVIRHDLDRVRPVCDAEEIEAVQSKFSRNAIALSMPNSSLAIKLFGRGSVHVTGCKTIDAITTVLERIGHLLQRIYGLETFPVLEDARLDMINVQLAWPRPLDIQRFATWVRTAGGFAEEPEKPPAVIVRLQDCRATAFAYRSGKFIVSARSPRDACTLIRFLCELQTSAETADTPPTKVATFSREYTTLTM